MVKHSVTVNGHKTSVSLEPEFWDEFLSLCRRRGVAPAKAIADIDETRTTSLSAAIRLYVLQALKGAAGGDAILRKR
jgi:predicted DNA-binding ribbon-helix-helix protein